MRKIERIVGFRNFISWKIYGLAVFFTEAVGALTGFLNKAGIEQYTESVIKPALTPPSVVFPIVWIILYGLMGFGLARIWFLAPSETRTKGLVYFGLQLFFNFMWSFLFFNWQVYGFAFLWLGLLWFWIAQMIFVFWKLDSFAAQLQIPYLLWVTFALYLNGMVWKLNL